MKRAFYLLLILAAFMAWRDWNRREIVHPPGVLVPSAPQQAKVAESAPLSLNGYQLTRRARFSIRARVLSREDYRWDTEADLSPMDLALGWGVMSDQAVLDRITISQGTRWYFTQYQLPAPIPDQAIITHSGNMHMVPADQWVLKKLREVRHGDILMLKGYLVDIDQSSGFSWHTSLRRDDTGYGSCEILYLEQIAIEERS